MKLKEEFNMPEPECMFDLEYFTQNPRIFYSFAHELWPGNHTPTSMSKGEERDGGGAGGGDKG